MYKGKIIDFHTHVFPEKLYNAIKNWFIKNVGWRFDFPGDAKEILPFLINIDMVEKFVCFGYAHKPNISNDLNDFYANLKNISKKVIPLGCFHQDDNNLKQVVKRALKNGLIGFKVHCQVQKVRANDERLYGAYEIIEENNGFILFHAGTGPFPNEFVGFKYFEKFLQKFPDISCIVAHLGCFEAELFMEASIAYPNLYLDTSYTFIPTPTNLMEAPINMLIKTSDKILFGSDFPGICHSYQKSIEAINNLNLNEEIEKKIFYENAKNFLSKHLKTST